MAAEEMGSFCSSYCAQELHVLAVDDSLIDRKVIERLLKLSCCKVTALESGSRALQYLGLDGERGSVGFDGLKGSTKLSQIPVVIMSSENVLARIDRCLEEGAEDFLVKPVKLADVARLRELMLRGEEESAVGRKRKMCDDSFSSTLDCSRALSSKSLKKRPRLISSD